MIRRLKKQKKIKPHQKIFKMGPIWFLYLKPFRNYKQKCRHITFENMQKSKCKNLEIPSNQDILASRAARKIFKRRKLSISNNLKDELVLVPVVWK